MKIVFLAPGDIAIPPNGWGALETVVWNQYSELKELNYDVHIVNEKNPQIALNKINELNPDIVHLHYGKHYELMPRLKCKKIVTNHDGSFLNSIGFHESLIRNYLYDCNFFCLTSWEQNFLFKLGISPQKIKILPNGVKFESFSFKEKCEFPNKSICLGKIDLRKKQSFIQSLNCNVDFAGQNTIPEFNPLDDCYLGIWNRDDVYTKLTNYSNLILISESELQPLVCLEAMSAGLGLVVSQAAAQNLDINLPFITVIPQNLINNNEIVTKAILENRKICLQIDRNKIREYAKTFSWKNIVNKYLSLV
jgi:glycosyltransferase involved in cell wall biosynthesis